MTLDDVALALLPQFVAMTNGRSPKWASVMAYEYAEAFMEEKAMREAMKEVLDTSDKQD